VIGSWRGWAWWLALSAAACARREAVSKAEQSAPTHVAAVEITEEVSAPPSVKSAAALPAIPSALTNAPIVALRSIPAAPRAGHFAAQLETYGATMEAELVVTLTGRPRHFRRAVALARLGQALGLTLVAPAALRPVAAGTLADMLRNEPAAIALLRARAITANDGTVDVLIRERPRAAFRALGDRSTELRRWARWASSAEPLSKEDEALTSSYVALRVLDYLSASVTPGQVLYDQATRELLLWDNPNAFSEGLREDALEGALTALRSVRRFPSELRAALSSLDRARVRTLFQPGAFESWLLPPRALVGLDERRATVLSLMDSRSIESQGP
jgi:hypothetical protein